MKRILAVPIVAAAFSLAAAVATSAQGAAPKKSTKPAASTSASVEEQIKKLETDRAQAVVRADVATLEAQTSDDYTLINANGQLSGKSDTMNAIKSGNIKLTSNELSDLKVRLYGNTAIVTGRSASKGTIGGMEIKGPILFTRVYVKTNGRWQSVAFQQTPVVNP
jgi:ketosteroid isomerase-like protein